MILPIPQYTFAYSKFLSTWNRTPTYSPHPCLTGVPWGPAIHFWFSVCLIVLAVWKQWVEAHLHHSWWPAPSRTCWHMMHMRTKCLPEHTPLRQAAETFSSLRRPDVPGSVAITARSLRVGSTTSQRKLNFTSLYVASIQCHHSAIKKKRNRPFPGK